MTKISLTERRLLLFSVLSLALSLSAGNATAKVSGVCGNCHTMHNSQDGAAVVHSGAGAGWDSNGNFTGGAVSATPIGSLLIADCVGCHSSTSDQTIVELGENRIPIVLNTTAEYPNKALAGGNFNYVARGADYDGYGHNVYGISAQDSKLTAAPGNDRCGGGKGCHYTLVEEEPAFYNRTGCQGCHFNVYHHKDNNAYRFLNSHEEEFGAWVEGVEHASWEHPDDTTSTEHNFYKGVDRDDGGSLELKQTHSISGEGEYAQYDPVAAYELQSPVAWIDPASPQRDEAIVMCLSCHRVHGSEHPDILRWDYDKMIAGEANDEGCFVCHTTKD